MVHSQDGLDEITTTGPTWVAELNEGVISRYQVAPQDFGLSLASLSDLEGGTPDENATIALKVLRGEKGPKRDIVLLNAAAAITAAGLATEIDAALPQAEQAIDSGLALTKLEQLKEASHG